MFGHRRLHDNLCTAAHCCPSHCFHVFFSFFRPPAAQERQGAVLVLTSPSVTLTCHYQTQLVPGPALLFKHCVLLPPLLPTPPHTPHPHPPTLFFLPLASPASTRPCSRLTCVHHGDKEKRGNEGKRPSIWTGYDVRHGSSFSSISPSFWIQLLWQDESHSDLFGLGNTGLWQTFAGD